jgi:hypothetical protein
MHKDTSISTTLKIEAIVLLSECKDYINEVNEYIQHIISNTDLDIDYRYKLLLSIEKFKMDDDDKKILINDNLKLILYNDKNQLNYRILSGQFLLQNKVVLFCVLL